MIKIARYNQEQKRFEIESTGCENMDELVDSGHEALHTRERIKLFDESSETGISEVLSLYWEMKNNIKAQMQELNTKLDEYNKAFNIFMEE
jgi:hypothetical protein